MANSSLDAVFDAVLAFLNAKNWPEKKRIVEAQRDLLIESGRSTSTANGEKNE